VPRYEQAIVMTPAVSQPALLSLRPADAEDEAFLRRLFAETQDQLALLRPNAALWNALVDVQYRGRKMTYGESYPTAEDAILYRGSEPLGRLFLHREPGCLRILDIAVLIECRGQGIGSWALRQCQKRAAEAGLRVELSVNPTSPARLLYERLGFRATEEDAMHVAMAWDATAAL